MARLHSGARSNVTHSGATPPTTHGSLKVAVLTHPQFSGPRAAERRRATRGAARSMLQVASLPIETWLILPVVIHLSQRLRCVFRLFASTSWRPIAALLPHLPLLFFSSHACTSLSIKQRNCEWVSCRLRYDARLMLLYFSHSFLLLSFLLFLCSSLHQLQHTR